MNHFLHKEFLPKECIDEIVDEINEYSCATDVADRLSRLVSEVEELPHVVSRLVKQSPKQAKTWLEPCELAALLDISTSTLSAWRRAGRFGPLACRKWPRGYQFHSELALLDAQEAAR